MFWKDRRPIAKTWCTVDISRDIVSFLEFRYLDQISVEPVFLSINPDFDFGLPFDLGLTRLSREVEVTRWFHGQLGVLSRPKQAHVDLMMTPRGGGGCSASLPINTCPLLVSFILLCVFRYFLSLPPCFFL